MGPQDETNRLCKDFTQSARELFRITQDGVDLYHIVYQVMELCNGSSDIKRVPSVQKFTSDPLLPKPAPQLNLSQSDKKSSPSKPLSLKLSPIKQATPPGNTTPEKEDMASSKLSKKRKEKTTEQGKGDSL